jgi:hypothetical protein
MKKKQILSLLLLSTVCLSVSSIQYFSRVEASDAEATEDATQSTDEKAAFVIQQAEALVLSGDVEGMRKLINGRVKEIQADTEYVPGEKLVNAVQAMLEHITAAENGQTLKSDGAAFGETSEDESTDDNPFSG